MREDGTDQDVVAFDKTFGLSEGEAEILRLLLDRVTTVEHMTARLEIDQQVVKDHLKGLCDKTSCQTKADVVALFVRSMLQRRRHCWMFARQPRVLIVDDEPAVVATLDEFLTSSGMTVYVHSDQSDVLATVGEAPLDFVISDVDGPKLDGLPLLADVRRRQRSAPMMIFLTGEPVYAMERSRDLGAVAFIQKPLNLSQLFLTIMENFVESRQDRNRLVRIDTTIPTLVEGALKLTIANIGFGGAFLTFSGSPDGAAGMAALKTGAVLEFRFHLETPGPEVKAMGEVVWRRDQVTAGLAPGVGIKFIDMDADVRQVLEDFVRLNKILSFIPLERKQ